ncbi:MAG: hypothetical protein ACR2RF_10375 [Geminicoccaceae bacterium]
MPAPKNPKHELFAQYLAEGHNQNDSYILAGYRPSRAHACRLATNGNILARVREIQDRRAKMADVTIEALTEQFEEAITSASKKGQYAAVMAGIMGKAKLHGLIIDKAKVEQGRLDGMSDDAIANDIEQRLEALAERRADGAGEARGGAGAPSKAEPDPELPPVSEADGVPQARD